MSLVAPVTQTVTVNAAFLQEIKEVNQELWSRLAECRRLCAQSLQNWREANEFVDVLREVRDQLAMHFALEEAYGYFEDPVAVAPRLAQRCEQLRLEHAELYVMIAELADQADDCVHERRSLLPLVAVQSAFVTFDERLQDHERREMEIIQEALIDDIGVGD